MKRLFLAIAMLAVFAAAVENADAGDVSVDFFYDTLGGYGNWVELAGYGYAWQPTVAVGNSSWRPYADGYWAYTDLGWTWVSYEDFGWATYHYGRWMRLRDRGWFWMPGYTWAPAWVSWRAGGDYIGWAPLPPDFRDEVVFEGEPFKESVDAHYDIGPFYYNFVDIRYIGEPVLRDRIFEPTQNVACMERTVNVTNITYKDDAVHNNGPDYNMISAYSTRPVIRMPLQRETAADPKAAAQSGALIQKQGDKLVIAAPFKIEQPSATSAPKFVKEKIAQPTIDKGWSGVGDRATVAQLKQKIETENPKQIPPPDIKSRPGTSITETAPPISAIRTGDSSSTGPQSPARAAAPAKGNGNNKRTRRVTPAASSAGAERAKSPSTQIRSPMPHTGGQPAQPKSEKPKKGEAHDSAPPGR